MGSPSNRFGSLYLGELIDTDQNKKDGGSIFFSNPDTGNPNNNNKYGSILQSIYVYNQNTINNNIHALNITASINDNVSINQELRLYFNANNLTKEDDENAYFGYKIENDGKSILTISNIKVR